MTSFARRLCAVVAVLSLLLVAPAEGEASPATLKRAVSNLTLWPLDLALSPVVAGRTLVENLASSDDSLGVQIAYPIPGFVWLTMVQAGAAVIRGLTGLFELVPGIILLPFETDLDPLFDPAVENPALVSYDLVVYNLRFGINYTTAPF